jgi:hypothetical protein
MAEEERKGSSLSGLKSDDVRFVANFTFGIEAGGGGGVEDLEEVDGFGDVCGFGDGEVDVVGVVGVVGMVSVVGVAGFGRDACGFLPLRSLPMASVSISGARKPSDFQTPEPLFVSTPCALICRKMTVGMVAMIMCVYLVW